jgi:hypothetical protein
MLRPRTQGVLRQSRFTSVFSPVFTAVFGGAGAVLTYVLFIPSGSDSLIDANGDTFKVRE